MSSSISAIWSAIAATAAAATSYSIFWIQRRSLLVSVRPELVLTDWSRRTEGAGDMTRDIIAFRKIRNVGQGAAFQIILNAFRKSENRPVYVLSTTQLPILASKEETEIEGDIIVWWQNIDPKEDGSKFVFIQIEILCWDSGGMRHETKYSFGANPPGKPMMPPGPAPGLMLIDRRTTTRSVWQLKQIVRWRKLVEKLRGQLPGLAELRSKKPDTTSNE